MEGWIKLHRKLLENPIVCKDADHLAIWVYLLLNATHKAYPALFKGERIELQPGQLITGRKSIATYLRIDEYKVQRVLSCFENEHQIAQQTSSKNRVISILSWSKYQIDAQQDAQQLHNNFLENCTTKRHQDAQQNNSSNPVIPRTSGDERESIAQQDAQQDAQQLHNRMHTNKNVLTRKKTIVDSDECDSTFETFWSAYPKKQGKAKAQQKWKDYFKKGLIAIDSIMESVEQYKRFIDAERARGFERQYLDGATFVNQQRWNDDWSVKPVLVKGQAPRTEPKYGVHQMTQEELEMMPRG